MGEDIVVINEFVVNPTTGREYVELLVVAPGGVDMRGFVLSDVNGRAGTPGATEGDITLPSDAYLSHVPQGTFVVVVVTTPTANSNTLTEDLSTTDGNRRLVLIVGTTPNLTTTSTFDIATAENLQLYGPGGRATGRVIDQVIAGTNTAYVFATDGTTVDATWGDNNGATSTDNINGTTSIPSGRAVSFCPTADTLAEFQNNDTGSRFTVSAAASYGTPGDRNTCVASDASINSTGFPLALMLSPDILRPSPVSALGIIYRLVDAFITGAPASSEPHRVVTGSDVSLAKAPVSELTASAEAYGESMAWQDDTSFDGLSPPSNNMRIRGSPPTTGARIRRAPA